MADNKVKKSFVTYLLVLVLILVAAFLIIIVVMMFSPFKNILGFQYILYDMDMDSADCRFTETTAEETIDFSSLDEINITCSYASVRVERIIDLDNHAIGITNKCKGFARASDNTDFNYEIYFEDASKTILNIEVQEPEGFLFFDRTVEIALLIPAQANYSLDNAQVNITSQSGNIYVGNTHSLSENPGDTGFQSEIDINALQLSTNSGLIYLNQYLNNDFNELCLRSNSGGINVRQDNLNISQTFECYTDSGDVNLTSVSYTGTTSLEENIILYINNGDFSANTLSGNVGLNISSGYFRLNNLIGALSSNNSTEQMGSASISIDIADGDVSLPFVNSSNVTIGTFTSQHQVYINATSGNIRIDEIDGFGHIATTSGNIYVKALSDEINLATTSGNINLTYDSSSIADDITLTSSSGEINLSVRDNFPFIAYFYDSNNDLRDDFNNIDIEYHSDNTANPFITTTASQQEGCNITITTNGHISISFI